MTTSYLIYILYRIIPFYLHKAYIYNSDVLINCFFQQVIIDSKKRVFTWGFGGYGRLGHADNKDEMVPRLLKFFEGPNKGATAIAAGSTFTFGLNEYGKYIFN